MMSQFVRFLIGVSSLSVILFWGFFLGQPAALSMFLGSSYNLAMALVIILSFIGICLDYLKGETLFGKTATNWVFLGGMTLSASLYLLSGATEHRGDLLAVIIGILVIGVIIGVMTLGIAYSLRYKFPKSG